jgi:hypothetical protein
MKRSDSKVYKTAYLPLLNEGHLLAKLYNEKTHKIDHEGAMVVLQRPRQEVWVSFYG